MRTPVRLLAAAPLILLTSCAFLNPPHTPKLEPGFQRERVTLGSSRWSNRNSSHNVRVGGHRFRVETRTRKVSANELAGGDGPSVGERAAVGVLNWTVRQFGINTVDDLIVVGTRTVTLPGERWSFVCQVAWIDQRERDKTGEETFIRVSQGMDCQQKPASDSVQIPAPWRFRLGTATTFDSLAAIVDTLRFAGNRRASTTATIERSPPDSGTYRVAEERFGGITVYGLWRSAGYRITRADGTTVGALRTPPVFQCIAPCVVDFGAATDEERVVLRFIAAALMAPLQ